MMNRRSLLKALALLPAMFALPGGNAGKKHSAPSYGVEMVWVNGSSRTIDLAVLTGPKGISGFWVQNLQPGETRRSAIVWDEPPGGFPPDWYAYGGEIELGYRTAGWEWISLTHKVKSFARLSRVTVTWDRHGRAKMEVEE